MESRRDEAELNGAAAIRQRWAQGKISRRLLYMVVLARPALMFFSHLVAAGGLAWRGDPTPFWTAGPYWSVFGTLADFGCMLLLRAAVRREGLSLIDLVSFDRRRLGRDIVTGIGIGAVGGLILILLGSKLGGIIAYGTLTPDFPPGAYIRSLPLWAVLYSRLVWWVIWSPTEELVFEGYSLPRLEVALGSRWRALALVSLSYSLLHCFLPFIDFRHALYMFVMFVPLTLFLGLAYLRLRRLTPLIIGHWLMDLSNVWLMTTIQ